MGCASVVPLFLGGIVGPAVSLHETAKLVGVVECDREKYTLSETTPNLVGLGGIEPP